jgi:hypothetical protein
MYLTSISRHVAETSTKYGIKCHSAQLPKRGRVGFGWGLVSPHAVEAFKIGANLLILLAQFVPRPPHGRADPVVRRLV